MDHLEHAGPSKTGEMFWGPAGLCKFLVTHEQTRDRCVVLEVEIAPNTGAPAHTHTLEDEKVYVVQGKCMIRLGDRIILVTPGHSAALPRGIEHRFWNSGDTTLRVILTFTPAGIERFFDEVSQPFLEAKSTLDKAAMIASLLTVGPRYGISFRVG
jgi:quercetin dioxygenase-like cupin family protein